MSCLYLREDMPPLTKFAGAIYGDKIGVCPDLGLEVVVELLMLNIGTCCSQFARSVAPIQITPWLW